MGYGERVNWNYCVTKSIDDWPQSIMSFVEYKVLSILFNTVAANVEWHI